MGTVLQRTLGAQQGPPAPQPQQGPPAPDPSAWVNPYDQQYADAMKDYNAIGSGSRYTPEQIQQRRDNNQRDYLLGLAGVLSGDESMGTAGGMVLKNALSMREPKVTERGMADPLTGEYTYDNDYLRQRQLGRVDAVQRAQAAAGLKHDADVRDHEFRQWMLTQRGQQQIALKGMGGGSGELGAGTAATIGADDQGNPVLRGKSGVLFKYGPDGEPVAHQGPVLPKVTPGQGRLPSDVARQMIGLESLDQIINRYESKLKDFNPQSPSDQMNLDKRAAYGSLYKQFVSEAKEAMALGALTGSDIELVTGMLSDPTGPRGMTYGRNGLTAQIAEARTWIKGRKDGINNRYPQQHTGTPPAASDEVSFHALPPRGVP